VVYLYISWLIVDPVLNELMFVYMYYHTYIWSTCIFTFNYHDLVLISFPFMVM